MLINKESAELFKILSVDKRIEIIELLKKEPMSERHGGGARYSVSFSASWALAAAVGNR
jgi:DNA-binding transcriptional ArsR family regulator